MSEYIVEGRNIIISRQGKTPHWTEIVRCRDCKHYTTNIHGSYCKKSITTLSNPDGFCAWGVRK